MSWLFPDALPFLAIAPAAGAFLWLRARACRHRLALAVGPRAPSLAPGRRAGPALFVAGLSLALVAALQPAWGGGAPVLEPRGTDVVLCLDVSRSMLARDVDPSRLERARREIRAVAARAHGDRIGLVLFAGEARLAVPLTLDLDSLAELAALADPLSVAKGGSDLGAAVRVALARRPEVVVLLTDGEDHEGRALDLAQGSDATIHCVGYGTARGAKIPVDGSFLRDRTGAEVVSALNPASLRAIAEATGGAYRDSLTALYEDNVRTQATVRRKGTTRANRFQWPLLAAFLLFLGDLWRGR